MNGFPEIRLLSLGLVRASALVAVCGMYSWAVPAVGQKTNVIVIVADDMAAYDVAALGNAQLSTPNLDKLADGGMVFNNAYHMGATVGAVCRTSRQQYMTGRSMWSVTNNLGSTSQTLGQAFNNAGYETFITSKRGNTYSGADNRFTFQGLRQDRRGPTGPKDYADSTISYMQQKVSSGSFAGRQTTTSKPYMAHIALGNPHDARDAPQAFLDRYGAISGDNPGGWSATQLSNLPDLPQNYLAQHPFDNGDLDVRDEVAVEGIGASRDPVLVRNELGKQYAVIDYMDQQIGRVLAQAEAVEDAQAGGSDGNDELDNTIVLFTSDHGIAVGSHGLMGKQNMYDHTLRVPMVVYGAGIQQGQTDANVYLGDIFPTLLDLTGIAGNGSGTAGNADDRIEHESFADAARGEAFDGYEVIYNAYTGNGAQQRAIKKGDWKLIHHSDVNRTQLFNLSDNPLEIYDQDLAHDATYYDKLVELKTALLSEMNRLDDPGSLGVHVGINVAFGKTATQSSTFPSNSIDHSASNTVDGAGSTLTPSSHTAADDASPFWMVDLENDFEIDTIVLHNREDCCQGRLRDIIIEILDEDMEVIYTSDLLNPDNALGGGVFDFNNGPGLLKVSLDPTWGQFVRVSRLGSLTGALNGFNFNRPSDQYVLSLDEVQVFAVNVPEPVSALWVVAGVISMARRRRKSV